MATKIGSLFGDVSLRTAQLDKDIKAVGKKLSKMGTGMKSLGKDLSMKLTAPITAVGVASIKSFADFEKGMKEVKSLMPDMNQGEFLELQQDVRDLAVEMGTNVVESTKALYQAISAGVPKENAIEFLRVSSQAAIAGLTSTEAAVDTLTSVLNAYKRPAEDAEAVADTLFSTVRLGKTTFDELGSSIFNVAPLAAAMNIPLEEISAAVATLTKQGVPTAQAMTQIRGALVALQKPNADMVEALSNMGYATGQALLDTKGLQGGLQAIRVESGLTESQLTAAFGRVEAFGAVLGLTGQNFAGAVDDLAAVTGSAKSMFQAFKENNEGLWRSLQKMGSMLREIGIQLGEQFAPYITKASDVAESWYAANKESIPGWVELGAKIAAFAAALGPLLVVMGQVALVLSNIVTAGVALGVGLGVLIHKTGVLQEAGEKLGILIVKVFERDWVGALRAAAAMMWELHTTFNPLAMGIDLLWQKYRPFWDWIGRKIAYVVGQLRSLYSWLKKVYEMLPTTQAGNFIGEQLGNLMYRAEGGPVSSGSPYIVGERGPELFVPRYSGTIVPNHELGSGGQTINMTFNGVGMEMQSWLKNNRGTLAKIAVEAVSENRLRTV